ncbi:hypothetical protein C8R47DRAFT_1195564 [Mycena vitilis]|nr:hypothetical protein C8R47DRAFT_1195564 [Mycena vitilis]
MTVLNNPDAGPDDQSVGQTVGGVDYLFSVPLLNPNNTIPRLAADAKAALGDSLDALLLGNEPDLYQSHKERPNVANYTVQIYQTEFSNTVDVLQSIYNNFAGPTICCDTQSWELENLLQAGYLSNFTLKYVTSVFSSLLTLSPKLTIYWGNDTSPPLRRDWHPYMRSSRGRQMMYHSRVTGPCTRRCCAVELTVDNGVKTAGSFPGAAPALAWGLPARWLNRTHSNKRSTIPQADGRRTRRARVRFALRDCRAE